jgi:hypothetical protein
MPATPGSSLILTSASHSLVGNPSTHLISTRNVPTPRVQGLPQPKWSPVSNPLLPTQALNSSLCPCSDAPHCPSALMPQAWHLHTHPLLTDSGPHSTGRVSSVGPLLPQLRSDTCHWAAPLPSPWTPISLWKPSLALWNKKSRITCTFSAQSLSQSFLQGALVSFSRKQDLDTKRAHWKGLSLLPGP